MKLSKKQTNNILKKLDFLKKSDCVVCHANVWLINDKIFELREFFGGGIVYGSETSVLPLISVTCSNCGNTIFFNAVTLGLNIKEENEK